MKFEEKHSKYAKEIMQHLKNARDVRLEHPICEDFEETLQEYLKLFQKNIEDSGHKLDGRDMVHCNGMLCSSSIEFDWDSVKVKVHNTCRKDGYIEIPKKYLESEETLMEFITIESNNRIEEKNKEKYDKENKEKREFLRLKEKYDNE